MDRNKLIDMIRTCEERRGDEPREQRDLLNVVNTIFRRLDTDHSGVIQLDEFQASSELTIFH